MIKIVKHGQMVETFTYGMVYRSLSDKGFMYSFPCSRTGKLEALTTRQAESLEFVKKGGFADPVIISYAHEYWEFSKARCYCGALIELEDPMDNFCSCGRCFNSAGQEVTPMAECVGHDDY